MSSIARRLRRAAKQGKRPEDITIKMGGRGRTPLYVKRNFTVYPGINTKGHSHEE